MPRVTTDDLCSRVDIETISLYTVRVNWSQSKACFPSNATQAADARKVRKQRERTQGC